MQGPTDLQVYHNHDHGAAKLVDTLFGIAGAAITTAEKDAKLAFIGDAKRRESDGR